MNRSSGASVSVDRRQDYYARVASVIAADPLSFYARAERGRRWLEGRFDARPSAPSQAAVGHYLREVLS